MRNVRSGLERILDEGPELVGLRAGCRVGLLCHAASVDRHGRHAIERLHVHEAFRLVRLFAPEHGLWGHEQDMEGVADAHDPVSGLEVVSLYGSDPSSLRPSPESLEGLDAVICDVQDVGSRYYTFVYTIAHVMESAAQAGLPIVVLDRPNPLGGRDLEGPVLRSEQASFVGRYPIPVRHGMTAAELAALFRDAFDVPGELRLVPMDGWSRASAFEDTGLPWVPPSPNMPTPGTARVYPGGCLVEGTTLSEGRGTTTPFELVGAPGVAPDVLAETLRGLELPGVTFRAASFRPMFQKHAGRACGGVQVIPTDRQAFRAVATYLHVLREIRKRFPECFAWRSEPYEFERDRLAIDLLLGDDALRRDWERGVEIVELERRWEPQLQRFRALRGPCLLYPEK